VPRIFGVSQLTGDLKHRGEAGVPLEEAHGGAGGELIAGHGEGRHLGFRFAA